LTAPRGVKVDDNCAASWAVTLAWLGAVAAKTNVMAVAALQDSFIATFM
jgi:hypothetical protein